MIWVLISFPDDSDERMFENRSMRGRHSHPAINISSPRAERVMDPCKLWSSYLPWVLTAASCFSPRTHLLTGGKQGAGNTIAESCRDTCIGRQVLYSWATREAPSVIRENTVWCLDFQEVSFWSQSLSFSMQKILPFIKVTWSLCMLSHIWLFVTP